MGAIEESAPKQVLSPCPPKHSNGRRAVRYQSCLPRATASRHAPELVQERREAAPDGTFGPLKESRMAGRKHGGEAIVHCGGDVVAFPCGGAASRPRGRPGILQTICPCGAGAGE